MGAEVISMNVAAMLQRGDPRELVQVLVRRWRLEAYRARLVDEAELDPEERVLIERLISEIPGVTALQMLTAAQSLSTQLLEGRPVYIREARQQGASWQEIGDALGVSRQAAHTWYTRAIGQHQDDIEEEGRDDQR